MTFDLKNTKIAVVGLGYVGMPLALALANHFPVVGFDVDKKRVDELLEGFDRNREIRQPELRATNCQFTSNADDMQGCNVFIVTVPTPITEDNQPDLSIVESASRSVAGYIAKDSIVVFESTVYPGVTEHVCGPILEEGSGLKSGKDFWLGYSPERINPGDTEHTVQTITKVVAGHTPEVTEYLAEIYGKTNGGNIFKAKDIKTAEASKVIENAQRDINVAFINEVTQIMNKLDLSVHDVLEAAGTKWNFLPFRPGLVGGHCIGVDPYYLAHCAETLSHNPEVILAGRKINDSMGQYFAQTLMNEIGSDKKVLILGFTFKENINDIRNTKVMDIYRTLSEAGCAVDVHDPHAEPDAVKHEYGLNILSSLPKGEKYDAVILAVAHQSYTSMSAASLREFVNDGGVLYDLKGIWRGQDVKKSFSYMTV